MSDSLSQIIIPLQKQRTSPLSTYSVCHSRLLATPFGLLGSACVSNLGAVKCIFTPISQSASRFVAHQVAGGKNAPPPLHRLLPLRKQVSQCFVCRLWIVFWDEMPSRAMICMVATGQRYLGPFRPFEHFPLGNWLVRKPCDFTFISKNRPSNNNKCTASVLLWPRGKIVHFVSPDVKDI